MISDVAVSNTERISCVSQGWVKVQFVARHVNLEQHHTPWSIVFILVYREYYGVVFDDGILCHKLKTGIVRTERQEVLVVFLHLFGIFILISSDQLLSSWMNRLLFELEVGGSVIAEMDFLHVKMCLVLVIWPDLLGKATISYNKMDV